jgi:hypothetical protein
LCRRPENSAAIPDYHKATIPKIYSIDTLQVYIL